MSSAPSRKITTSLRELIISTNVEWKVTHVWTSPHFRFDEPKEVFLVHATGMMHVGVYLSHIVKISSHGGIKDIIGHHIG